MRRYALHHYGGMTPEERLERAIQEAAEMAASRGQTYYVGLQVAEDLVDVRSEGEGEPPIGWYADRHKINPDGTVEMI